MNSNTLTKDNQPLKPSMRKKKRTPIEQAERDKQAKRQKECRQAILKRLLISPASLLQLDQMGYTQTEIDRQLNKLLDREQVFFNFFDSTYRRNFARRT